MITTVLVSLVAAIHACFVGLEMFIWEGPRARRVWRWFSGCLAFDGCQSVTLSSSSGAGPGDFPLEMILGWLFPNLATGFMPCPFVASGETMTPVNAGDQRPAASRGASRNYQEIKGWSADCGDGRSKSCK